MVAKRCPGSSRDAAGQRVASVTSLTGGDGFNYATIASGIGAVPEPATWASMIVGFALLGGAMRRRRSEMENTLAA